MEKLPKTHIEFCNMLHDCIDLSDYPEGTKLFDIIKAEKPNRSFTIETVQDWLQGLRSACTIPFENYEIEKILQACGNGDWTVEQYWRFAASRIKDFATNPEAYK